MKVLGRSGRIDDLDVVFGSQLQKPLQPGARVLRPMPSNPCGRSKHDPAQPPPFVLGAGDELIDDHLSGVHEVAELGLPEHEAVRAVKTIAVLETQARQLRERAVVDFDRGLVGREVLERDVGMPVLDNRTARRAVG